MGAIMMWMLLWGPFVLAVLVAILLSLPRHRVRAPQPARLRLLSALAGGIPAMTIGLMPAAAFLWRPGIALPLEIQALLPLLLGIASAMVLIAPLPRRRALATADLSPRSVTSFVRRSWPVSMAALTAAIIAITLAAGFASHPDELGHFTKYSVSIGTSGTEIATGIYGWHYSVPSLIAVAVLIVTTVIAWASISRPAWGDDVDVDTALRQLRSAHVGRVTVGALLVHLAVILRSLASTASLQGSAASSDLGTVWVGTPFAAIAPVLTWASHAVLIAGLVLWLLVALSAAPTGARRRAEVTAS